MSRGEVLAKLLSVRHFCFRRGVLGRNGARVGGDDDFRQAFRIVNRLYVLVRLGNARDSQREGQKQGATRRRRAA